MLEQELKFTVVDRALLDAILTSAFIQCLIVGDCCPTAECFSGAYLDTPERALEHRRCSLRVRQEGAGLRAALKLPGRIVDGLSTREEYEVDVHQWPETVSALPDGDFRSRLARLIPVDRPLVPRVRVDMKRRRTLLQRGDSILELVLDDGTIHCCDASVGLCEIELELKQGDLQDLLDVGKQIEHQYPLTRSRLSKHEIGLKLCEPTHGT